MDDNRLIDQDTGEILNQKDFLLPKPSGKIIIRAIKVGRTNYVPHVINGNNYKIVVMGDKQYIADCFFLEIEFHVKSTEKPGRLSPGLSLSFLHTDY